MLEEENWDLVEGFGLLEENLYSDFMFFMPSVLPELAGFSHSSLPSERYLQAESWHWTSAFCSFYWPSHHIFKYKSVLPWYGCIFNKPACRIPGLAGKQCSNFAKLFLWFEVGCTCLDSSAHTEGGVRDAGWLVLSIQTCSAQAVQELDDSWPVLFQKLFMYLLLWNVFIYLCKHLTWEVLTKVRDSEYQRQDVNVKLNIFPNLYRAKAGGKGCLGNLNTINVVLMLYFQAS